MKIVENWKTLGYNYKCTTQDECILHTYFSTIEIKLWEIKLETLESNI